jgi:UDP-N-acetylmuramate-alanine ligase
MEIKDILSVYFVGAGGIGMSAIARYFISRGMVVAGYDKTPSDLTRQLEKEGMLIHYEEDIDAFPRHVGSRSPVWSSTRRPFLLNTKSCSISANTDSRYRSGHRCSVH